MGTVFHYCSVDTFVSIITNGTLRATNIRKSNDKAEVSGYVHTFQAAVRDAIKQFYKENPEDNAFKLFAQITEGDSFYGLDTDSIIKRYVDNNSCTYYATCFSRDGNLLSQWQEYADGGRGVSIGFNENFFARNTQGLHFKYSQVHYDLANVKEFFVKRLLDLFEARKQMAGESVSDQDYQNALFEIINIMVYNTVFFKNPAFSAEKEFRIVYYPFGITRNLHHEHKKTELASDEIYYDKMMEIIDSKEKIGDLVRMPMGFMVRGNGLTSYVDMEFKKYMPFNVPEIILGPECRLDDHDLRLFLIKHGFDLKYTKIRKSQTTYQNR